MALVFNTQMCWSIGAYLVQLTRQPFAQYKKSQCNTSYSRPGHVMMGIETLLMKVIHDTIGLLTPSRTR